MTVEPLDSQLVVDAMRAALPVRTDRLVLRWFEPGDLDAVRAYQQDVGTMRFLYRGILSDEQVLERVSEAPSLGSDGGALGIAVELDGELVGETVVKVTDLAARQAEIGWIMAPASRGRGIATEAARATLSLALDVVGAHRVTAVLDPDNTASARIAERIGMRREALMRHDSIDPATGDYGSSSIWALRDDER